MIGEKLKTYWKLVIHWLSTLRHILHYPFNDHALELLDSGQCMQHLFRSLLDIIGNNSPPLVGGVRGGGKQEGVQHPRCSASPPPYLPHQGGGIISDNAY